MSSLPTPASRDEGLSSSAPLTDGSSEPHPFGTPEAARYSQVDFLGRGGMGRVTAVFDRRLDREVARKDVPADSPGATSLEQRLAREAWVTARLDHPGIVPIHDAGTDASGRPYFTMRLIRGRSLAAAMAAHDLDQGTLLRHFLGVCHAVAHAHSRGIVHRDLKPDNIMLGPLGETQVVDWGVARVLGVDEPVADTTDTTDTTGTPPEQGTARTAAGARVGTDAWMSPEQAAGDPAGKSSDVYSLGLILGRLVHTTPELRAILERATALVPADRYPDAGPLAADVAAYLDGRRVTAFSYTPLDLARRFYRAFRAPILVAAIALVAVLLVLIVAYTDTRRERDRALAAEAEAQRASELATTAEAQTQLALSASEQSFATLLVERAIDAHRQGAHPEAEVLATAAIALRDSAEPRAILAHTRLRAPLALISANTPPACRDHHLSPEGRQLVCLEGDAVSLWSLDGPTLLWRHEGVFDEVAWVGRDLVIAQDWSTTILLDAVTSTPFPSPLHFVPERALTNGTHTLIDTGDNLYLYATKGLLTRLPDTSKRLPWALSGDGLTALTFDESTRRIQRIDLTTQTVAPFANAFGDDGPMSAALNHDGSLAAFGTTSGRVVLVPRTGPERVLSLFSRPLSQLLFSPEGQWLAVRDERGFVALVDTQTDLELPLSRVPVKDLVWREGKLITLGDELLTWQVPDRPAAHTYRATAGISALALSPDGDQLALADGRGAVTVHDLESGRLLHHLEGEDRGVAKDVTFVFGSGQATLAIVWPGLYRTARWAPPAPQEPLMSTLNFRRIVGLDDGSLLAASYGSNLFHFATSTSTGESIPLVSSTVDLVVSQDGSTWAALTGTGAVYLGHGTDAHIVFTRPAIGIALDAHGDTLAIASDHTVDVIDPTRGTTRGPALIPPAPLTQLSSVAFSRDASLVAAGTLDGRILVWSVARDPTLVLDGRAHAQRVSGLVFTASDDLISASWDGSAMRWRPTVATTGDLGAVHGFGLGHATRADLR